MIRTLLLATAISVLLSSGTLAQSQLSTPQLSDETPKWAKMGIPWGCRFWNLPKDFEYDAIGVYQGNVRADPKDEPKLDTSSRTWAIKIDVTSTERPVLLLVSSYESVKWSIEAKAGATILGVVMTGYSPSVVKVINQPEVKVIDMSGYSNLCGNQIGAYSGAYSGEHFKDLQMLATHAAGRPLSTFQGSYEESHFIVGPGATHIGEAPPPELNSGLKERIPEIQALIDNGTLHLATSEERLAWLTADSELTKYGLLRHPMAGFSIVYTVTKPFKFSTDYTGADSREFIIPKGVRIPTGRSHNTLYFMTPYKGCIAKDASSCTKAPTPQM